MASEFGISVVAVNNILKRNLTIKTLAILLGEHPCIMNIFLGPVTVHYREVSLYIYIIFNCLPLPHFVKANVTARP